MIKFKPPEKPKFLAFSFYDKNEVNKLFYEKLMIETKNVFNLTLFCYNIFDLYKKNIYDELLEIVKNDIILIKNKNLTVEKDYNTIVIDKLLYYFDEYVKIKDQININNTEIYKYIINYINCNNIIITKNNFDVIHKTIYDNLLNNENLVISPNKDILFDSIIYNILYSVYNKNYIKIKNIITNHETLPSNNNYNDLINEIKNKIFLTRIKSSDFKEKIDALLTGKLNIKKLNANLTYIGNFVYKKLGNKTKYLQSTMIFQVINKVNDSISSYYRLLESGYKANKPKYLKFNDIFNLFYVYSDIVVKNNKVYLFTSEYLSKNFSEVFGNDYIYLDNNKYVHKKYLNKINNQKIKKGKNYIYNDYYISKLNKHIIDSRYIVIDIFRKIQKEKIKNIEIKKIFGTYKIIFTYENSKNKESTKIQSIEKDNMISIDLGVNNLLTIYNPSGKQYIVSGGPLKSLNYYVTKKIAKGQKEKDVYLINKYEKLREDKINDYFNKIVKWLTKEYSQKELIIIGYNKSWKDNSNLGKKSNLIFNKIPFVKLINKIKMKFNVITTEESYTSKCDSLSLEDINKQEIYSGKRITRGLFKSLSGKKINADLNGAVNIMRKQINLSKVTGENIYNPIRVNIFHEVRPVDNVC